MHYLDVFLSMMHWKSSLLRTHLHQSSIRIYVHPPQAKYNKDLIVFKEWLQVHQPFAGYQPHCLVSITTGVVADASVNCDGALKIGLAAASKINGKSFTDVTLHRKDKVKTMGDKPNTITVREKQSSIQTCSLIGSPVF